MEDSQMEYSTLSFEVKDAIGTITLNRPDKLNALNRAMIADLTKLSTALVSMEAVKVVIITGAGRAFCAGGDLMEMQSYSGDSSAQQMKYMDTVSTMTIAYINIPKPVIAAVNGPATGAGNNIALGADIAIASDKAKFSEIFAQVGLVPDVGGTYLLPRIVGLPKAKELAFTMRMVEAEEALRLGMVSQVVPHDSLMEQAYTLARSLVNGPSFAYAMAKRLLNRSFENNIHTVMDYEMFTQAICLLSHDCQEGANAFLEKRKPSFKGF
jgi:2-(1,2-epoxy-1,2-dihydrophenyl)acetyl-CoA isomerase